MPWRSTGLRVYWPEGKRPCGSQSGISIPTPAGRWAANLGHDKPLRQVWSALLVNRHVPRQHPVRIRRTLCAGYRQCELAALGWLERRSGLQDKR